MVASVTARAVTTPSVSFGSGTGSRSAPVTLAASSLVGIAKDDDAYALDHIDGPPYRLDSFLRSFGNFVGTKEVKK